MRIDEKELNKILSKGHCKIANDSSAISVANMEPVIRNELATKEENERFDSPVCIHVCSYRHRLADTDGISAKAAIDGIVKAGILEDDSAKIVKEVSYSQVKIKKDEEEKTVITIAEILKEIGIQ